MFENSVLRRKFGPKNDDVQGNRQKYKCGTYNLYSSLKMNKSKMNFKTCIVHGRNSKCMQNVSRDTAEEEITCQHGLRWKDNVNTFICPTAAAGLPPNPPNLAVHYQFTVFCSKEINIKHSTYVREFTKDGYMHCVVAVKNYLLETVSKRKIVAVFEA
jgi:hypothetical protein